MYSYPAAAVLVALTLLGTSSSWPTPPSCLTSPPWLNDLARERGKLWFGTAADIPGPEQQDEQYMTILNDTNIFGELTPANYMKVRTKVLCSKVSLTFSSSCTLNPNRTSSIIPAVT